MSHFHGDGENKHSCGKAGPTQHRPLSETTIKRKQQRRQQGDTRMTTVGHHTPKQSCIFPPTPSPPVNPRQRTRLRASFLRDTVSSKRTIHEAYHSDGVFHTLTARASCSPRKAAAEEEKFERRCQWADGFWASSGLRLRAMMWACPMLLSLCLSLLLTLPSRCRWAKTNGRATGEGAVRGACFHLFWKCAGGRKIR